jgi:hypothetical protein
MPLRLSGALAAPNSKRALKQNPKGKEVIEMEKEKNMPVKKFKAGAISATVWENQAQNQKGELISFKSISFDRNYKDANGEWQKTNSLRTSDIPRAVLVLSKAYEFLALNNLESSESDDE